MHRCLLDVLPTELFYIIFDYFSGHEILTIFSNVTPYINKILLSYSNYQVNFKSILKFDFDCVCQQIRPDQIVSLTLSDADDTAYQSELFLSHFQIESFTRLRSLTLHNVETKSLLIILQQICKLNRNFRLSLENCDIKPLASIQIPFQLRYLKFGDSHLESINDIEYVLLNLPHLKHFELHGKKVNPGLANGHLWENITSSLATFNFIFHLRITEIEPILHSFRTFFWSEKRWFVAYENDRLFTVPRFANDRCIDNFQSPVYSTALDDKIFTDSITTLVLSQSFVNFQQQLPNVRTLQIASDVHPHHLSCIINVKRVEHLILSFPILQPLSNIVHILNIYGLRELSIMTNPFQLLEQLKGMQFKNIRTLTMPSAFIFDDHYPVEQLCFIFPCVQRLRIDSINKAIMIRMIDGFIHLSDASFCLKSFSKRDQIDLKVKPEWALYEVRRLKCFTYTCRYENSYLHVWISEQ
ncbi:unnamed protein product, partial [Rotaria sp. Silwood2]